VCFDMVLSVACELKGESGTKCTSAVVLVILVFVMNVDFVNFADFVHALCILVVWKYIVYLV
jgi:hypothetical protein